MSKTKTIDGMSVTSSSLEPTDAYDLMPELAAVFAPLFGQPNIGKGLVNPEKLLRDAQSTLGGGKLTELMIRLLAKTVIAIPGEKGTTRHDITDRGSFNLAFAGRMWSAIPCAAFAFEVTFGNFTDVLGRLAGVMPEA